MLFSYQKNLNFVIQSFYPKQLWYRIFFPKHEDYLLLLSSLATLLSYSKCLRHKGSHVKAGVFLFANMKIFMRNTVIVFRYYQALLWFLSGLFFMNCSDTSVSTGISVFWLDVSSLGLFQFISNCLRRKIQHKEKPSESGQHGGDVWGVCPVSTVYSGPGASTCQEHSFCLPWRRSAVRFCLLSPSLQQPLLMLWTQVPNM